MLKDDIIIKNHNLKIKNTEEEAKRIIIDCEDDTEYYCPKCGSYHYVARTRYYGTSKASVSVVKQRYCVVRHINTNARSVVLLTSGEK